MRVILLTHGGADLVIERLASIESVEFAGVFIERPTSPDRSFVEKLRRSLKYDGVAATAGKAFAFRSRQENNGSESKSDTTVRRARELAVPVFEVDDLHSASTIEEMQSPAPDLAVIFGTNIIRENVYSIPRLGSINLHQGMAPYYRGGPPVFWELFNDEKEIGLTVHFVAAKVDTGDIVLQEKVPLDYDRSFGVDFEGFIHNYRSCLRVGSAELIGRAVEQIASGSFERVPQDTSLGRRYRLPTKKEKDELRRRLKARLNRGEH